jgi:hypothetical protein
MATSDQALPDYPPCRSAALMCGTRWRIQLKSPGSSKVLAKVSLQRLCAVPVKPEIKSRADDRTDQATPL